MAVLLTGTRTRTSTSRATASTMPTSRTVWLVLAMSYLLLTIDAAPTTDGPMLGSGASEMKPEAIELKSEANNFTLKINLPFVSPSNITGTAPMNQTVPEPEVIVRGNISAEFTDIGRRLVVHFEADRHGNTVKFNLEPSLSITPKLGAMTLKNTVG